MSHETKSILRRVFEDVWNQGNLDAIDELFAVQYVGTAPPESMTGPEGYRELVKKYRSALPDIQFKIEEMIGEGEKVAVLWRNAWTHEGEINGVPATGTRGGTAGVTMCRIVDARIVEEYTSWDALGFLQQIGAIPG